MNDQHDRRVREARQTFKADGPAGMPAGGAAPAKRYRAKVFKSGNSLALRLPAELGLEAGMEMDLRVEDGGRYSLSRPDAPKRKIDVSKFAGKLPGLKELPRYEFDDSPRDWAALDRLGGRT
jgi:antitoxin VapB